MKLLVLSDTHLHKPGWGTFGHDVFQRALELAQAQGPIDVVLHSGDLVEPSVKQASLRDGLELLATIPAKLHLWVAGNNDIEFLDWKRGVANYARDLQEEAKPFGVHLLDAGPVTYQDVTFVGNFGFYDMSLWQPPKVSSPNYPNTLAEVAENGNKWHRENMGGIVIPELFELCQSTLHRHLAQVPAGNRVVVATHTVPHPDMVLYGSSPAYDFQNAWMGWDDRHRARSISKTPNLIFQFCGHTHRSKRIDRPEGPLINSSGRDQPYLHIF